MDTQTLEPRRRGARPRLVETEKFSTQITAEHRRRLEKYAARERISLAEAIRRLIETAPENT